MGALQLAMLSTAQSAKGPGVGGPELPTGVEAEDVPFVELMAECALLRGRPHDAIALLSQLLEAAPPARAGAPPAAPPPAPPLQLSLLAAAWQCAGDLRQAAFVSSRALTSLGKLPLATADEHCTFWLRRGHCSLQHSHRDGQGKNH